MRETPAAFEARTGVVYDPVPSVLAHGAALGRDEACPTLFRCPGACGFAAWADALAPQGIATIRRPGYLAPPRRLDVLMSDALVHEDALGATFFGTIALLGPLAFAPVRSARPPIVGPEVFVIANHAVAPGRVAWVPPAVVRGEIAVPWDLIVTPDEAWEAYGAGARDAWAEAAAAVVAYLAEIDAMVASGLPGPGRPWCTVPAAEREARLAAAGVVGAWTHSFAPARRAA